MLEISVKTLQLVDMGRLIVVLFSFFFFESTLLPPSKN